MKKLVLVLSVLCSSAAFGQNRYDVTVFDQMPQNRIVDIQMMECVNRAQAMGRDAGLAYADKCTKDIVDAFEEMELLNEKRITPSLSWSICLGQSRSGNSYNYPFMVRCMRVVNEICPVKQDGEYVDYRQCYISMNSGYWINNPNTRKRIE